METKVGIIMGSSSDLSLMKKAADLLQKFGVGYEIRVISAHRAPDILTEYATTAAKRGLKVIIAGAGGAAHLPGVTAAMTILQVIGVPVKSSNSLDGWDSILSILQMPQGVPVATVALDNAANAGILAVQILALSDAELTRKLNDYKVELREKVLEMDKGINL